ncbi:hypothetical protein QBC39DRAFT_333292 [Podospora conica]|nr:hypothetical protein QBC39DRAFT_333292 [Schizothecium conicum]
MAGRDSGSVLQPTPFIPRPDPSLEPVNHTGSGLVSIFGPGLIASLGRSPIVPPGQSLIANPGSDLIASPGRGPIVPPGQSLIANPGSDLIANPGTSSATISADDDSDDYNLNAAIRKVASKQRRPPVFPRSMDTVPLAFRNAKPLPPVSNGPGFTSFLGFQTTTNASPQTTQGNDPQQEVNKGAEDEVGGKSDKTRKKNKKKHRHHHHNKPKHSKSSSSNSNNNKGRNSERNDLVGGSQKRPIVLGDSDDDGGNSKPRPTKRTKTGESSSLARENPVAITGERREVDKAKPREERATRLDDTSTPEVASTSADAAAIRRSAEEAWAYAQGPTSAGETRPTPISTIIAPVSVARPAPVTPAPANPAPARPAPAKPAAARPAPARPAPAKPAAARPAPARPAPARPAPAANTRQAPARPPLPAHALAGPIPNNPNNTEEFRRKRLEEAKRKEKELAAQKEARERQKDTNGLPTDDGALFKTFSAKVPQPAKTTIVNDLPSQNFQRPETGRRAPQKRIAAQSSTNIFRQTPRPTAPAPVGRPRRMPAPPPPAPAHPSQPLNAQNGDDDDFDLDDDDDDDINHYDPVPVPVRRAAAAPRRQPPAPPPPPAPRAPPRSIETVPARLGLGGPDRLVFKYSIFRTKPFVPQGVETRESYKVEYLAGAGYVAHQANEKAQTMYEKPKKGVVGKSFCFVVGPKSGARLFEGTVKFEDGKVQYFWVGEGVVALEEAEKGGRLVVDRERVEVVRRKRWDVISVKYTRKEEDVEEVEDVQDVQEVQKVQEVQEMERVLVIDCGGGGEDVEMGGTDDGQGEDGDLWGGTGTPVETADVETVAADPVAVDPAAVDPVTVDPVAVDTVANTTTAAAAAAAVVKPTDNQGVLVTDTETQINHHGSFTTLLAAQESALRAFLLIARPEQSQPEEARHHYKYIVVPEYKEHVKNYIDKGSVFYIEWDPHMSFKWSFVRLTVEVFETELTGPLDLSDLIVDGSEGVSSGGVAGSAPAAAAPTQTQTAAKKKPASQMQRPATVVLRPTTPPPQSPVRVWAVVAPATAPENLQANPNTNTSATATATATQSAEDRAARYAAAKAARYAAAGVSQPGAPQGAPTTPPFAKTKAPFAMMGDDESEESEEE